jgi:acyl-CoA synthetase (AMP-forming)/AMP-acid ligase II
MHFTEPVTLLSILALDGIAMPLSPSFPVGELDYILDNSQTGFLLATEKYTSKAQDVLDNAGDSPPVLVSFGKRISGGGSVGRVDFRALANPQGGMMLYTSGTTNRPVRPF